MICFIGKFMDSGMWIIPLICISVMFMGGFFLYAKGKLFQGRESDDEESDDNLKILKKRLAEGKISREEFENLKKDLAG